jgi:putative transposase
MRTFFHDSFQSWMPNSIVFVPERSSRRSSAPQGHPLEIGGVADHVHILFSWRTDEAISVLARNLKANSSRWIHETFPDLREFSWQEGYAIFSVSESLSERVSEYIRGQPEHHRKKTFQEELVEFLRAHRVDYDEKICGIESAAPSGGNIFRPRFPPVPLGASPVATRGSSLRDFGFRNSECGSNFNSHSSH